MGLCVGCVGCVGSLCSRNGRPSGHRSHNVLLPNVGSCTPCLVSVFEVSGAAGRFRLDTVLSLTAGSCSDWSTPGLSSFVVMFVLDSSYLMEPSPTSESDCSEFSIEGGVSQARQFVEMRG